MGEARQDARDTLQGRDTTRSSARQERKQHPFQEVSPWGTDGETIVDLPLSDGTYRPYTVDELDSLISQHPLFVNLIRRNLLITPFSGLRFPQHVQHGLSPFLPHGPLRLTPFEQMSLYAQRYRDFYVNPAAGFYTLPQIDILGTILWWLSVQW
ncbi:MAG: hypothetical protein WB699_10635 [Bacteroidota bacterium]